MYLIVNNSSFLRVLSKISYLGLDSVGGLCALQDQMPGARCTLRMDAYGALHLTRINSATVLVNGEPVPEQIPMRIKWSDEIKIAGFVIHLRDGETKGALSRALSQKRVELQAELHNAVLDRLRTSTMHQDDKDYRSQIAAEIDMQLETLSLSAEMEEFLSVQALCELMIDRERGYGRASRKMSRDALSRRFDKLINQIDIEIRLTDDDQPEDRTDRIETLVPWLARSRRDLIEAIDKRDLAIGLLREQLIDCIVGLGPLEDLMVAPDISEIMLLPSGDIFIERYGKIVHSGRRMPSVEISRRVIERIVTREGRRIDQTSPMVDARLADGSRGNFIIEPVSVRGPVGTLRRFSAKQLSIDELISNGSFTMQVAAFLKACVQARKNIVISGGTGSGKTTLLNALSAFISPDERIVTIEDTAEINLPQDHVVTLQAKNANLEGKGEITIRELVKNALRMRPDRIVIGECRSGEALDMLQAMNTGHDGSLTTIHANTPKGAIRRIVTLAQQAEGMDLSERAILEQAASALDVIVQISRHQDGSRRIDSVCELVGLDEDTGLVVIEEIYRIRHNRKKIRFASMEQAFSGYVPTYIESLIDTGVVTLESML